MPKEVKIYLNTSNSRYAIVKVFPTLKEMRKAYHEFRPDDKAWNRILGASCHFEWHNTKTGRTHKEIANVFLHSNHCGAGVVCHELLHACLWAYKFKKGKSQYPIILNNMDDEEELLHNHSHSVMQFYRWFYENFKT